MFLYQLRDELWNTIRWKVQDKSWWSDCDKDVLAAVGKKCAEGMRTLGFQCPDPLPNRTREYYKNYVNHVCHEAHTFVYHWQVFDGSMTRALSIFKEAAAMVDDCTPSESAAESTDEVRIVPAKA